MKCKKCSHGILDHCPECGKPLVICLEAERTNKYIFWDEKDSGCQGLYEE